MEFWLGTHRPNWLEKTDVPLMVSHRTLGPRKSLPAARGRWVLDSGGFSELSLFGEWRTSARDYVAAVRRYMSEIGGLTWAAIQDWMCEPFILKKTGLSVIEHQRNTIFSYLELMSMAPEVPWCPVIQGWAADDYLRHVDAYLVAGVDLTTLPVVGIGSVCRRQGVQGAINLLVGLAKDGLKLHGFGLKTTAVRVIGSLLKSSDSLAWSYEARRRKERCGVPRTTCANHLHYALEWRDYVLSAVSAVPHTASLPMFTWL